MERLDKFLCGSGAGTRSQVKAILKAGRVAVDGKPETDGSRKIDPALCTVTLDGETLGGKRRMVVMLNKPAGYVTATEDASERTVMELLPPQWRHLDLKPVGRLDKATEGLLLFTNDGELSHCLTHPSRQVEKTYVVDAEGAMTSATERRFLEGVEDDGETLRARRVRVLRSRPGQVLLEVVLCEGRKREVRRMCAVCGLHVVRLARVSFGGVELGRLPTGGWRRLTPAEVASLRESAR